MFQRIPAFFSSVFLVAAAAGVVDRVAVVVGNTVFTETEVMDELRITQFLNGQPLNLGPDERRAAAERLVDQQLIRSEMEMGHYPAPSAQEADAMLRKLRQERFRTTSQYRAALTQYGIGEEQLKKHLLWQLTAIRFTDQRFSVGAPSTPALAANQSGGAAAGEGSVDEQMSAWLKEARARTRIAFKKGAFE